MKKFTFLILGAILALTSIGGCKTPTQTIVKVDSIKVEENQIVIDTTNRNVDIKVTIQKKDSNLTEVVIKGLIQDISNMQSKKEQQTVAKVDAITKDNLTPTLEKIKNKGTKDSLKQQVKLEKEHTKQVNGTPLTNIIRIIIAAIILVFLIFLWRNKK